MLEKLLRNGADYECVGDFITISEVDEAHPLEPDQELMELRLWTGQTLKYAIRRQPISDRLNLQQVQKLIDQDPQPR